MLALNWNKLTSLPDSIGKLKSLETLYLGANELTSLPDSIGNLTSLEDLYLYQNQLTSLPDFIGNLASLKYLYLYQNQLTSLPDSIRNLTSLSDLDLRWNCLPKDPPQWLQNLLKNGILYYYTDPNGFDKPINYTLTCPAFASVTTASAQPTKSPSAAPLKGNLAFILMLLFQ